MSGDLHEVPEDPGEAKAWLVNGFRDYFRDEVRPLKAGLARWYGEEAAESVEHVEAFEVCEYGRQPSEQELRTLFPFFPAVE